MASVSGGGERGRALATGGAVATAGALWAIGGIVGLLVWAVYRLARISIAAFDHPFAWYHWAALLAIIPFMAWSEGLRGFQLRFSPRVAERAMTVRNQPTLRRVVLAPLFAAGYFEGTRRERLGVWLGTVGILVLIVIVHRLDQPWRGILDAGVVVGPVVGDDRDAGAQRAGLAQLNWPLTGCAGLLTRCRRRRPEKRAGRQAGSAWAASSTAPGF